MLILPLRKEVISIVINNNPIALEPIEGQGLSIDFGGHLPSYIGQRSTSHFRSNVWLAHRELEPLLAF